MEPKLSSELSESTSLGGYIYNDEEEYADDEFCEDDQAYLEGSSDELEEACEREARDLSDLSFSGISAVAPEEMGMLESLPDDYVEVVENLSDSEASEEEDASDPRRVRKFDYALLLECMCAGSKRKLFTVWLPETLVFVNNRPVLWYFTRQHDGTIAKRNFGRKTSMTNQQILAKFGGLTGEITSYFVHVAELDNDTMSWKIQYFDRKSLRDFLYDESITRNGFLQKFVSIRKQKFAASSDTNQLLQTFDVRWKKNDLRSTSVQTRSYVFHLHGDTASSYKYGTAELHDHRSTYLSTNSTLTKKAQSICRYISESMKLPVDGYSRTLRRMNCTLRMGKKGILWFQFCTCLRFDRHGPLQRRQSSFKIPELFPSHSNDMTQTVRGEIALIAQEHAKVAGVSEVRSVDLESFERRPEKLPTKHQDVRTCSMCSARILAQMSCSVTYGEVLSFLLHLNVSLGNERLPPDSQRLHAREAAHDGLPKVLWSEMQLREEEEVGLHDLSCRLQMLGISQTWMQRLILEMASSDDEVSGFVGFDLFRLAVQASQEPERVVTEREEEERRWQRGDAIFSNLPVAYQFMSSSLHTRKVPSVFNELALHLPEHELKLLFKGSQSTWTGLALKDVLCCVHCKRVCKLFVEAKLRGAAFSDPHLDKLRRLVHPNSPTLLGIMWDLRGKKTRIHNAVDREWSMEGLKGSEAADQRRRRFLHVDSLQPGGDGRQRQVQMKVKSEQRKAQWLQELSNEELLQELERRSLPLMRQ